MDQASNTTTLDNATGNSAAVESTGTTAATDTASTAATDSAATSTTQTAVDKPNEPINYQDFTVADDQAVDADLLTQFKGWAADANLSQDAAQKLVDQFASTQARRVADWREQTINDPEIGGPKLDENLAYAAKAREMFGSDEFTTLMNMTGLGNHPAVVKAFINIGKAISEDGFMRGGNSIATSSSPQGFYSKSNMNP